MKIVCFTSSRRANGINIQLVPTAIQERNCYREVIISTTRYKCAVVLEVNLQGQIEDANGFPIFSGDIYFIRNQLQLSWFLLDTLTSYRPSMYWESEKPRSKLIQVNRKFCIFDRFQES